MYTLTILYYEWGKGGLGGFMCRFGTTEHILEGMETLLHITASNVLMDYSPETG